ncbi:d227df4e-6b9b-4378-944f-f4e56224dff8 [Thermothielavioides terrestris]|uniref:D227df4e-6b9b-4378-944f-f4e56224dff8 n=1 Tax=Thermothielavioides terrestris TaxID=2587410 RepID=A0A3S4F587_9PEZI|nr:d227df4e-6b9b-4378-944f-f4e56224dff8 [Thermothielavioides terrestris]
MSPPPPPTAATRGPSPLGPLVRLRGISTSHLPAPAATTAELAPLLTSILREALPFIDSAAPRQPPTTNNNKPGSTPTLWKRRSTKTWAPSSTASSSSSLQPTRIERFTRVIPASELRPLAAAAASSGAATTTTTTTTAAARESESETWVCRRSEHADRAERGTASWAEFERCFRDEHAAAEVAFTPAAVAGHEALVWAVDGRGGEGRGRGDEGDDGAGAGAGGDGGVRPLEVEEGGRVWGRFTLKMVEMRHRVGRPVLKDRTFPVLQMTAAAVVDGLAGGASDEFVVVSIPVPDFALSEHSKLAREPGALVARYVSVERFRRLGGDGEGRIEWLMATASDAGGVLPMWVQNMATPGVIWKDVPLFLDWIAREREARDATKSGPSG